MVWHLHGGSKLSTDVSQLVVTKSDYDDFYPDSNVVLRLKALTTAHRCGDSVGLSRQPGRTWRAPFEIVESISSRSTDPTRTRPSRMPTHWTCLGLRTRYRRRLSIEWTRRSRLLGSANEKREPQRSSARRTAGSSSSSVNARKSGISKPRRRSGPRRAGRERSEAGSRRRRNEQTRCFYAPFLVHCRVGYILFSKNLTLSFSAPGPTRRGTHRGAPRRPSGWSRGAARRGRRGSRTAPA